MKIEIKLNDNTMLVIVIAILAIVYIVAMLLSH